MAEIDTDSLLVLTPRSRVDPCKQRYGSYHSVMREQGSMSWLTRSAREQRDHCNTASGQRPQWSESRQCAVSEVSNHWSLSGSLSQCESCLGNLACIAVCLRRHHR